MWSPAISNLLLAPRTRKNPPTLHKGPLSPNNAKLSLSTTSRSCGTRRDLAQWVNYTNHEFIDLEGKETVENTRSMGKVKISMDAILPIRVNSSPVSRVLLDMFPRELSCDPTMQTQGIFWLHGELVVTASYRMDFVLQVHNHAGIPIIEGSSTVEAGQRRFTFVDLHALGIEVYVREDTDMFAQVLESSMHIVYMPDALVWHRHRRKQAELIHCIFGYGVGLYSFLVKRFVESQDLSSALIRAHWVVGPFFKVARRRWHGERAVPSYPFPLLLAEASGACMGPLRFWQAYKAGRHAVGASSA